MLKSVYRITYMCADKRSEKTIHISAFSMDAALTRFVVERPEKYSDAFRVLECVFESLYDEGEFHE